MSNLIPMSGYPVPVRPYSQITPFTYRDNSTYLEILEQLRTWIQNTLVPHLDTEYEELVQSWADNIELLTTQYETLLTEYETAHQGDLDAMATTLRGEFAAEDSDIRTEFRAADSDLSDEIAALSADLNAQIQDIINNSVAAQDSVVSQLILDAGSLTTAALNGAYATDLDIAAINTHLGTVDSHLGTLDGEITTVNSNATTLAGRVTANEASITTINTHLVAVDSKNNSQDTAISTNTSGISDIRSERVGDIVWSAATSKANHLLADGSAISRTTYATLFAKIGTAFGAGNGSTTFNIPDARNRSPISKGVGTFATLGAVGGEENHTLTTAETPSHTHTFSATTSTNGSHQHAMRHGGYSGGYVGLNASGGYGDPNANANSTTTAAGGDHAHTVSGTTGSVGSGSAHNNMHPYIVLNAFICYA